MAKAETINDPYVRLAAATVDAYVNRREIISLPAPLAAGMDRRGGVFVTLYKEGELRGCIGTFLPLQENVAQEIINNAIQSASADPRFPPVPTEELSQITCSVDILSPPEPCQGEDLDPKKYGVIVECDWRRELLLPDLPGIGSVAQQLQIARMKAGIGPREPITLYRFTVERHHE